MLAAQLDADPAHDADADAFLADAGHRAVIEEFLAAQDEPALADLPLARQRHYARQLQAVMRTDDEVAALLARERPQLHDEHVACLLASTDVRADIDRFTRSKLGLPLDGFFGEERERLVRAMYAAGDLRLVPGRDGIIRVEFPTLVTDRGNGADPADPDFDFLND
jgi:hypothetical protein